MVRSGARVCGAPTRVDDKSFAFGEFLWQSQQGGGRIDVAPETAHEQTRGHEQTNNRLNHEIMDPELVAKKLEYEAKKARAKALQLRLTCTICGAKPKTLLNCPCGTTQCAPGATRANGSGAPRRVPGRRRA